jgi:predicted ABC-type transport system involved in lysophospholipase L1 biosynthesis ATPase subunit
VLLADEPTGNLDETTGEGIHDLLARWNRERAITVVVVTHNPRLALRMPRRVRLTKEGIADEGAAEPSPVTPPSTPAAPGM